MIAAIKSDNLTYADMENKIAAMTDEEKACNVTVFVSEVDEFYPIATFEFTKEGGSADGILDVGHPVLCIAKGEAKPNESLEKSHKPTKGVYDSSDCCPNCGYLSNDCLCRPQWYA